MLARVRASSFLAGLGLGSLAVVYTLRADLRESHRVLAAQVATADASTDARLSALEAAVSRLDKKD